MNVLRLRPRAFISFSVFETPDETLALVSYFKTHKYRKKFRRLTFFQKRTLIVLEPELLELALKVSRSRKSKRWSRLARSRFYHGWKRRRY